MSHPRLKLPINLKVLIPLTENCVDGKSTKPGDVVIAKNGKTIQVDNTDAEGRLILADALCYADTFKVNYVQQCPFVFWSFQYGVTRQVINMSSFVLTRIHFFRVYKVTICELREKKSHTFIKTQKYISMENLVI